MKFENMFDFVATGLFVVCCRIWTVYPGWLIMLVVCLGRQLTLEDCLLWIASIFLSLVPTILA